MNDTALIFALPVCRLFTAKHAKIQFQHKRALPRQSQTLPSCKNNINATFVHSVRKVNIFCPRNSSWNMSSDGMMTSSNGNIFRVHSSLCRDFTGHWWIAPTEASDAELWFFSLICTLTNDWVNNRYASDLKRHSVHYDITVMVWNT